MTAEKRRQVLCSIGALGEDIDALLVYTENVFSRCANNDEQCFFLFEWLDIWDKAQAICENRLNFEMFDSAAGTIPVILTYTEQDFEKLIRELVYKGKEIKSIGNMGASFVSGKTVRFIVLSNKPYSGIPASFVGLTENEWHEKSLIIRKHHECAHYYTKRILGSSKNNLHDELIADFCGLYAAFGEYRAAWFVKFFGTRFEIYTKGLSATATSVVMTLAGIAADSLEQWTKTEEFALLDEAGRIEALAEKELLSYVASSARQVVSSETTGGDTR